MLIAARHSPPVLLVLFSFWVLSPFAGAAAALRVSRAWSPRAGAALRAAVPVMAAGSLAAYAVMAFAHPAVKLGLIFLAVPFASWLILLLFGIAGRLSRPSM